MTDLPLTPREKQVCDLICRGWNSKEIGRHLGLSHRTAEDHWAHIKKKCGVRNPVELVRVVHRLDEKPAIEQPA